jgi:hypothetical protein
VDKKLVIPALVFCGSFLFGVIVSSFFHELGHALAAWGTGRSVLQMHLNPFGQDFLVYSGPDSFPLLTRSAGEIFEILAGTILLVLTWRKRNPYYLPVLMVPVAGFLTGGLYLVLDLAVRALSDSVWLVWLGVPPVLIYLTGALMIAAGYLILLKCLPLIGLALSDPESKRVVVLRAGMFPYAAGVFLYGLISDPLNLPLWITRSFALMMMAVVLADISRPFQRRWERQTPAADLGWRHAAFAMGLGMAIMILELVIFS